MCYKNIIKNISRRYNFEEIRKIYSSKESMSPV